jgi:hypothetical protein
VTHRPIARLLVLLTAALLLAGQGAALHHDHKSAADCPPGSCLEHASHAEPVATLAPDSACPFCAMLAHGRAAMPAPAPAALAAPDATTVARAPDVPEHAALALAARQARAPPLPA